MFSMPFSCHGISQAFPLLWPCISISGNLMMFDVVMTGFSDSSSIALNMYDAANCFADCFVAFVSFLSVIWCNHPNDVCWNVPYIAIPILNMILGLSSF